MAFSVLAFSLVSVRAVAAALVGALAAGVVATPISAEPSVTRSACRTLKKGCDAHDARPLLATLAQTHTDERVVLDDTSPEPARFEALLADRVTGSTRALDPRLLGLLRTLAARYPQARIELVSGYRSPKLNEMLRKKGHQVASHSQHSLGQAVDFRVVPAGAEKGVDPRELDREIRAAGWSGGVGVYLIPWEWFVHADVGPRRNWRG